MAANSKFSLRRGLKTGAGRVLPSVATIALALLVGAVIIILSGNDPLNAYKEMVLGAFGTKSRFSETVIKAVPLTLLALGTSVAYRAKVWNIGSDGQFTIGAILAVFVAQIMGGDGFLTLACSFLAAVIGGAVWGGIAGALKARFQANEVITTLMLNYVANYLLAYLIRGPMMDPNGGNNPQSAAIAKNLYLPTFVPGLRMNVGVFLALFFVIVLLLFWRSRLGYSFKLIGASQPVARYAGRNVPLLVCLTMVISGGIAGIAGWAEIFGAQHRLLDEISSGYGNLAIVVALLGNLKPVDIAVASFFFAALLTGGNALQRSTEVPVSVVSVIQGLVIIFIICRTVLDSESFRLWRYSRRAHRDTNDVSAQEGK